jgi:hypothetical protein
LPAPLQLRLARASERLALVETQRAALDTAQREHARTAPAGSPLARLVQLKGVAATSAAVLLDEGLLWREFRNRREIGGLLGFTPTPYASGDATHEQGISRAGNNRLQVTSIQLAWSWVHWQPQSALSRWYRTRFGTGRRARRIGIVAVARKLVIALWRYATTGVVPAGAILKTASGGSHARGAYGSLGVPRQRGPKRRRYHRPRVRFETAPSQGAARCARARIEAEAAGHRPVLTAGLACDRMTVEGSDTRGLTPTRNIEATGLNLPRLKARDSCAASAEADFLRRTWKYRGRHQ